MSPTVGALADIAKKNGGEAVAFGLGFALSRALEPASAEIRQQAWKRAPIRAVEAGLLAEGVAQGQVDEGKARAWAAEHGYGDDQFSAMVDIANVGPAIGQAFEAWRRGHLSDAQVRKAFKRAGLEDEWVGPLMELKENPLEPAEIAKAIHRGIIRGAGLLVAEPPLTPGHVPMVPPSGLDPVEEASWSGIDKERLRVMVGNAGLPPGIVQMLQMLNRGVITTDDFQRGVAESNMRNEWGQALLSLRRHLLTPHEYVEARLRGWIDDQAMHEGAALVGMDPDDADLLAKLSGRPLSFHQVFIGLRRGGKYGGPVGDLDPAFLKSLQESNVRPEWYDLAWAQRFSYPSAFVLRQLAAAGELTAAEAERILLYQGWEPGLAKTVSARWAGAATGGGKDETKTELADEYEGGFLTEKEYRAALTNLGYTGHAQDLLVHLGDARRTKRYREKAIDAIAAAFVAFKIDDTRAVSELAELNVTGEAANLLLALWRKQRIATIRELTPAQIKRAFGHKLMDRPTALEALHWHHYTDKDAATLLDE